MSTTPARTTRRGIGGPWACWIAGLGLAALVVMLLRVQVEWQWFGQFSLQTVLLKRWAIAATAALCSLVFSAGLLLWRRSWLRLSLVHADQRIANGNLQLQRHRPQRQQLEGWRYGLSLLVATGVVIAVVAVLLRITWVAWSNPFALGQWWDQPFPGEPLPSILALLALSGLLTIVARASNHSSLLLLGSVCVCITVARGWGLWTLALAIPTSGIQDPLLAADLSFGLGRFSALALLLQLLLAQLVLATGSGLLRRLTASPALSDWSFPGLNTAEKRALRPLLAAILCGLAGLVWLSRHQLLWSQNGVVAGAGWLDVHWILPLREGTALALLALAVLVFPIPWRISRHRWRRWVSVVALGCLLLELLLTPLWNWLVIRPRELVLEAPYIARAIQSTRRAFQLDAISTRSITPASRLTPEDLVDGASTLRNVRLWDSQPLLATNRQLQQLRVYYRFSDASVDRYQLTDADDQRQQVIISARELDQDALPDRSRTWLNRHFVFTHGFGFTLSPVNTRAQDGLPDYFISDLGKATRIQGNPSLGITQDDVQDRVPIGRAALYFGILPSPYAVAPTAIEELDYPEGDDNTYNHYDGTAGLSLANPLQRLAAAVYLKEPRLLNTGALQSNSKLLVRREVRQRLKALAPFLHFEGDPYLVSVPIAADTPGFDTSQNQYWIVDGYTTSTTYPYAADLSGESSLRYIRNSVKAVVDAYNGSVHLYVNEPADPIIQGWTSVFPELFQDLKAMPPELRSHLMVPNYLYELQVQQLLRYHVTDPRIFYSGDDVWQVPMELYGNRQIPVAPYHITAQLTPATESEFLLLQPLTPLARPNLSGWLAARSDGEHYGELVLLRFPSDLAIFGPEQIQALINQDPTISQQFGLWDRAGSDVVQGNLLVLPVGDALLYVEPVYLKAQQGGLPALTRVVVSDGRRVAMDNNLADAIQALLQGEEAD
ncbi:MAG: UPF0182 family protein [Synechococcus sp.]